MPYTFLDQSLQKTADAVFKWLVGHWGIRKSKIKVEAEVYPDLRFCPTFTATAQDQSIVCVEVSNVAYSNLIDEFVLGCQEKGLPVRLFMAVPTGLKQRKFQENLKRAKRACVGIIEIDTQSHNPVQNALPLHLSNVRPIQLREFPPPFRQALQEAERAFRDGHANKACAEVYDLLEDAFRRVAQKCYDKGIWPNSSSLRIRTCSWAKLIRDIDKNIDRTKPSGKPITDILCGRILGVTPHRNQSGHIPSLAERIRRDRELKTRFEHAVDLLREFLAVAKKFKI